jgi:hypothetical protein
MGIDLTALAQNTEIVPFTYAGLDSSVEFRPSILTTENISKFGNVENVGDIGAYMDFMAELIVDWEVSMDGERLKVTATNVAKLPLPMLGKIMDAIVTRSGEVDPEPDGASVGGSFQG